MWLWAAAHAVDDLYQGLVPACVPYFVLDRHYGYLAASGLTMAAALGSSVPQPFVGMLVDRYRLRGLAAAGVAVAGVGLGLSGLAGPYPAVWALILLSGLGVAMFHPAAGKAAREAAEAGGTAGAGPGGSTAAMSLFAAGGSVGFFLAPVLATPALAAYGVRATVYFLPPALLAAFALLRQRPAVAAAATGASRTGTDRWRPFLFLTAIEVVRSVTFFGVITFVELFWLRHLHTGRFLAGTALAVFLVGGVAGTLLGGRVADRAGLVRTVRYGTLLTLPALTGLRWAPGGGGTAAPLAFAALAGIAVNIPFGVLVKLGQDYLPTRPGTATGVTLGLAVSIGGLVAPALGATAEAYGPQGVFTVLCALPPVALALARSLPEPGDTGPAARQEA